MSNSTAITTFLKLEKQVGEQRKTPYSVVFGLLLRSMDDSNGCVPARLSS
jgi:hypothetical protein